MKPKRGDIVVAEWIDTQTYDEWSDIDDFEAVHKPMRTAGVYIGSDKDYIVISHTVSPYGQMCGTISIPKKNVESFDIVLAR